MMRFTHLLLMLAVLAALLPAQTNWFPLQTAGTPQGRCNPAMGSDPFRQVSVMFGGIGANNLLNDTWEFNGTIWRQVNTPNSPPARQGSKLVYDWFRNVLVLFGGTNGSGQGQTTLADMWEYDGNDWTLISTPAPPPSRGQHGMAYDFIRSTLVVFGGTHIQGSSTTTLADTWEWDRVQWRQVLTTNSPPARVNPGMVYRWQGETFLFGGTGAGSLLKDTWTYDGMNWTQRAPINTPPAQAANQLTYDQRRDRCVFLDSTSTTWEWDGTDWLQLVTAAAPTPRENPGIVFDLDSGRVVLFGGCVPGTSTRLSDTWIYRAVQPATVVGLGRACGVADLLVSTSGLPWIGARLFLLVLNVPVGSTVFFILGSSSTSWNGAPLPFDMSGLGLTGCWLYISPDFVDGVRSPNGIAASSYPVPNNPALVGSLLFAQALARAPQANAAGYVTTGALKMTIGGR